MINYNLVENVINKLIEKQLTVASTESCTGGLVGASIVSVAGASAVFNEGYITYSNEAKHRLLGVSNETLDKYGAVSEETASEMVNGVALNAKADIGISTTGIAGPDGGTIDKPVGLVYIGVYIKGATYVSKNIFSGDRTSVREQAVNKAFEMVLEYL